jgi:hypothetical protein
MTAPASGRPLRAKQALSDFGWFYALFATFVSAPSLLSLLQAVFEHRFVDALQWIVDGYDQIVAVGAAYIEPLLAPIVSWLNETFNVNYGLHAHWRPAFVLSMVIVMSFVRTSSREADLDPLMRLLYVALWAPGLTLIAAVGALYVGLVPLDSGWYAQARIAAVPVSVIALIPALIGLTSTDEADGKSELLANLRGALVALGLGVLAFGVAALLSLYPGLARGAGVVTLALFVCVFGLYYLVDGLRRPQRPDALAKKRMGLTMLGGFATAALIVAADMALRALGAS